MKPFDAVVLTTLLLEACNPTQTGDSTRAAPIPETRFDPPPANSESDPARPSEFVGGWQDADSVGSGYSNMYLLWPDGRYTFHVSQMAQCEPHVREETGRWHVESDSLVFEARHRTEVTGGTPEEYPSGCAYENETVVQHELDGRAVSHPLTDCSHEEQEASPAPCRRFANKTWWRIFGDPDLYEDG